MKNIIIYLIIWYSVMYKNIFFKKIEKMLDKFESIGYNNQALRDADVAHPVERHLAKVEVASSSLVIRSNAPKRKHSPCECFFFLP